MRRALIRTVVLAAIFAVAGPANAEPGSWEGGGPPAGAIGTLAADPFVPGTVYGGGTVSLFKSVDAGRSWRRLGADDGGLPFIFAIEADPVVPGRLFAAAGNDLYRSVDGGETWHPLGVGGISVFALLPGASTTLVVVTYDRGMFRSTDAGETWEPAGEGIGDPTGVYALASAPSDGSVVYALGNDGIYQSTDGGSRWELRTVPPVVDFLSLPVVDPNAAAVLFVVDRLTLWRSRDGGTTWQRAGDLPVAGDVFVSSLAVARTRPATVYAVTDRALYRSADDAARFVLANDDPFAAASPWTIAIDPIEPARIYRASGRGVFVSEDAGTTFEPAISGLPGLATDAIAAGADGSLLAGTWFGGVYASRDGGGTWVQGSGDEIEFESVEALALADTGAYAGTYRGRLFASRDGGLTWAFADRGLPRAPVWGIAADPMRAGRVLVASELGVYATRDGGEHWRRSTRGLPNTGVRALAFARSRPATVYAGLDRRGVFVSANGGRSWRAAGLDRLTVLALAVDPERPGVLYAATRQSGAFRSADGGRTWRRLVPTRLTAAVAIDVESGSVLLASASAVLRSTDDGATFEPYEVGLPERGGTPLDPEADVSRTVVALAAVPGGAYAATWAGVYGVRFA